MFGALARRVGANDQSISRFLIAALAVGFLLLLAAGVAATQVTRDNQRHTDWVAHTYQVEIAIEHAQMLVEQAEATRRGYVLAHEQLYYETYVGFERQIAPAIDRVAELTRDNPRQQRELAAYRSGMAGLTAARTHTIALVRAGDTQRAVRDFVAEAAYARMRHIRDSATRLVQEERRLLAIRTAQQRRSARIFFVILGVAGLLLTVLVLLTVATVLRFARDLAASAERLRGLNENLEERVGERTADLTRANEEIQRFAYIVSHDLRSPLVNVMGFTAELEAATGQLGALVDAVEAEAPQLLSEDAKLSAREDLPEAIGFIRASTQKMDRLINAILQLSRQGRRQLAPERIDVAQLVGQIRDTLTHRLADADATLEVDGALPEVISDRFSLDQVFSNLIENAVKYLRPGVPGRITVSGRREAQRVIYAVADNGRGIDPRDHARVFDLFRRSGAQDKPGEGIGLATVRALVFRLGGTISVESNLGQGATFTLSLPLTLESQLSEGQGKNE